MRSTDVTGPHPGLDDHEAVLAVTDKHGHLVGHLDLDAVDSQFMVDAISGVLNLTYGPWRSEDADRLLAEYGPSKPG